MSLSRELEDEVVELLARALLADLRTARKPAEDGIASVPNKPMKKSPRGAQDLTARQKNSAPAAVPSTSLCGQDVGAPAVPEAS
jgi:hypothetical protein